MFCLEACRICGIRVEVLILAPQAQLASPSLTTSLINFNSRSMKQSASLGDLPTARSVDLVSVIFFMLNLGLNIRAAMNSHQASLIYKQTMWRQSLGQLPKRPKRPKRSKGPSTQRTRLKLQMPHNILHNMPICKAREKWMHLSDRQLLWKSP